MTDKGKGVDRRIFLRLLSGSAMAVASGGFLTGCGGGGGGSSNNANNGGAQTFNYPNVILGTQTGSLTVTTQTNGTTTGSLTIPAASGAARPRAAAQPHDAMPLPVGTYTFSGVSTAATGGFTVAGNAAYIPFPQGPSIPGPFTLAVTVPTATTAGAFTFTFNGSAYPGTIPPTNVAGGTLASVGVASLVFPGLTGITPPLENPVDPATFIPASIQITFGSGSIQSLGTVIEYHVYRDPEPTVLQNPNNLNASAPTIAKFAPLPIISPATSPAYDSIQDIGAIVVAKPDPTNNTNPPITDNFFESSGNGNQIPITGTGLSVGDRVRYRIEALYSTGVGASKAYALSAPVYTNYVTYLQPPLLSETSTVAYPHHASENAPDNDAFQASTGPNNIVVTFRAVYINPASAGAGLKYALDFSTDLNFSPIDTLRYTQITPAQAGSETNPRGVDTGAVVQFGGSSNPNSTPIDLTSNAATSKLGSSPAAVYVRVGVRDVRDPDDSTFIYSTLDGSHYTDPITQTYTLPASLTPGGGNRNGSARRQ